MRLTKKTYANENVRHTKTTLSVCPTNTTYQLNKRTCANENALPILLY